MTAGIRGSSAPTNEVYANSVRIDHFGGSQPTFENDNDYQPANFQNINLQKGQNTIAIPSIYRIDEAEQNNYNRNKKDEFRVYPQVELASQRADKRETSSHAGSYAKLPMNHPCSEAGLTQFQGINGDIISSQYAGTHRTGFTMP